jgi:hypothetical protein
MDIVFCCVCDSDVTVNRVTGRDIYPHRKDLYHLSLIQCSRCNSHAGCHQKSGKPLGSIPTPELRKLRVQLHARFDYLWKSKQLARAEAYRQMGEILGKEFHIGEVRSVAEYEQVVAAINKIREALAKDRIR